MLSFYVFIGSVVVLLALIVGLVSGIYFKPPDLHSDKEIFQLAGIIFSALILVAGGFFYFRIKGTKQEEIKKLFTNR